MNAKALALLLAAIPRHFPRFGVQNAGVSNRRRAPSPPQPAGEVALLIDQQLVAARTQFSRAALAALRGSVDAEHQVQEALQLIERARREVLRLTEWEAK